MPGSLGYTWKKVHHVHIDSLFYFLSPLLDIIPNLHLLYIWALTFPYRFIFNPELCFVLLNLLLLLLLSRFSRV